MDNRHTSEKKTVALYILSYLVENPKAEDSLEGILEWWLLQQSIRFEESRVKEALQDLIKQGFVIEVVGPDKRTFYRINDHYYDQIQSFLEKKPEQ